MEKITVAMIDHLKQILAANGILNLTIRVRTHAASTQIKSVLADGSLKIDLAAAPKENRANIALLDYLADVFSVSLSNVVILSGATARLKLVRISSPMLR